MTGMGLKVQLRLLLGSLRRSRSGLAMTEFALSLPLLLTAGLWGAETANMALVHMRISQLAMHIADDAARIGDTSKLNDRKIFETDINDLLLGANIQSGGSLDFFRHGRAIISSLEVDDATGRQFIHWQRCKGRKVVSSSYGNEGTGLTGGFAGMGPPGEEVIAQPGEAVIFVEVSYEYQPLVTGYFVNATTINAVAAFTVRDDRDLTQVYQRDPSDPAIVSRCSVFDDFAIPTP
jgi:hypothetical protein